MTCNEDSHSSRNFEFKTTRKGERRPAPAVHSVKPHSANRAHLVVNQLNRLRSELPIPPLQVHLGHSVNNRRQEQVHLVVVRLVHSDNHNNNRNKHNLRLGHLGNNPKPRPLKRHLLLVPVLLSVLRNPQPLLDPSVCPLHSLT